MRKGLIVLLLAMVQTAWAQELVEGEVRKVDRAAKKLTLKHGYIKALEMPAMTMVFQVKDAALLKGLKRGEKVKFVAEKLDGGYYVTRIEATK